LLQACVCVAPLLSSQAAPPASAGAVMVYVRVRLPGPQAGLHAVQADQLPTQCFGAGGMVKVREPAFINTIESKLLSPPSAMPSLKW
jgi:hypothetical protein